MLSHEEMVGFQAEKHDLIDEDKFITADQYVLHLMHAAAYTYAARLVDGKSVLDIGCNTGYGTSILATGAKNVAGVDVSDRAIKYANAKYANEGLTFQVVDGARIPFEDNAFDVVTSFQVVEHLVEYESFFREVRRVLAPGGIVILTTPNSLLRLDPGMKPWNEFHVREFNPEELASTLMGYFNEVSILGLYANEPLYTFQVNRLDKARRMARAGASGGHGSNARGTGGLSVLAVRMRIKKMLPAWVLDRLKKVQLPNKRQYLREIKENHGVADFYYRTHDLNDALDFMAVCSDVDVTLRVESISKKMS